MLVQQVHHTTRMLKRLWHQHFLHALHCIDTSCETPVMNLLPHLHKLSHPSLSPISTHRKDKWTFKIPLVQTFLPHFTLIMSSLWPWRSYLVRHAKNCTMASIFRTNSNDYLIEAFVRFPYQCRRPWGGRFFCSGKSALKCVLPTMSKTASLLIKPLWDKTVQKQKRAFLQ